MGCPSSKILKAIILIAVMAAAFGEAKGQDAPQTPAPIIEGYPWALGGDVLPELHVKFAEGTGVRLRGGQWVRISAMSAPSASASVNGAGFDNAQIDTQLTAINVLIGQHSGRIFRSFERSEARLEKEKAKAESATGKPAADLNLCYVVILPPESSKSDVVSINDGLSRFSVVSNTWAMPLNPPWDLPFLWTFMPECSYWADSAYFDALRLAVSNEFRIKSNRAKLAELDRSLTALSCGGAGCRRDVARSRAKAKAAGEVLASAARAQKKVAGRVKLGIEKRVARAISTAERKILGLGAVVGDLGQPAGGGL